jgi:hypothetical protein
LAVPATYIIVHHTTVEEVKSVTEAFQWHYNQERPHQGRSCRNQPPAVAHPVLPKREALPERVDPDGWLNALDGRWYPRRVKRDGSIKVDGTSYYIKQALASHHIMLRLNATTRCFDVFEGEVFLKSIPIKGLCGQQMALDAYIDLMRERARAARTPTAAPETASTSTRGAECVSQTLPARHRLAQGVTRLFFRLNACLHRLLGCFPYAQSHLLSTQDAPVHASLLVYLLALSPSLLV